MHALNLHGPLQRISVDDSDCREAQHRPQGLGDLGAGHLVIGLEDVGNLGVSRSGVRASTAWSPSTPKTRLSPSTSDSASRTARGTVT